MLIEKDPALSPEDAPEDVTTVVDPPTTEAEAEPEEESEGSGAEATHKNQESEELEQVEITLAGEEESPSRKESAPDFVKKAREVFKENRRLEARIAELERERLAKPAATVDPGPKPMLEDYKFDQDEYDKAKEIWDEKRRQKDAADARAAQEAHAAEQAWKSRLDTYGQKKAELSKQIPDYADAEAVVKATLDVTQQGLIVHAADNAALVVCALGQRPELAKQLAAETDPVRFVARIAKLEANLKTTKKTQVPPPEKKIRGSASAPESADSQLEKLREEASESKDFTKLNAHKRDRGLR